MIFIKYLLIFIVVSCSLLLIWHILTKKYINPYKLTVIIGPKGSGKTTDLTKRALYYINKGYRVYCTEKIPGTYQIDAKKDIGKFDIPRDSVVLIDEAGMIYDNRKYKDFPDYVRDWFKLQRHRHLIVFLYSQSADYDIKIRLMADAMYILEKYARVFTIGKGIYKKIVITESTGEQTATVSHNLAYLPLLTPGSRTFTFIPKYAGLFDSFIAPPLRHKEFIYNPIPDELQNYYKGHYKLLNAELSDN